MSFAPVSDQVREWTKSGLRGGTVKRYTGSRAIERNLSVLTRHDLTLLLFFLTVLE